jgi:hypothetical protein
MIKWNPRDKANKNLEHDFSKFFSVNPPRPFSARIQPNPNTKVQKRTEALFSEICTNDVIFAYEKGRLHGLCSVEGKGEHRAGGHRWVPLPLADIEQGYRSREDKEYRWVYVLPEVRFHPTIDLLQLRKRTNIEAVEWMLPGLPRTLYELSQAEVSVLLEICLRDQPPELAAKLKKLLSCCIPSTGCRVGPTGTYVQ